jgi:ribosomal protein S18 acetylase RimI-like enzyme
MITIQEWQRTESDSGFEMDLNALAELLWIAVHGGAGVSFVTPFSLDQAREFWIENVLPHIRSGKRRMLVARDDEKIVGTVQLDLDVPPNQQHRAAVTKLLVHPESRRLGIGRSLMLALEDLARAEKRTLLTLDTVTESNAENLYRSIGFVVVGVIPEYAHASVKPEFESTTVMYKKIV